MPYRRVSPVWHQGERLAGACVEREALELAERDRVPFGPIDDRLKLLADLGHGLGIADHLHAGAGRVDEVVERQHRQHRFERPGRADPVQPDHAPAHAGRRKIGIDDRQLVAMPHGAQHVQQIGMKQRVDPLEHDGLPDDGSRRS